MSHTRKLFTLGVALLVLLALVPLASAQYNSAPPLQATATSTAPPQATVVPTAVSTAVGTPAALPKTGEAADNTPWTITILLLVIAGLFLAVGFGMAVARRTHSH